MSLRTALQVVGLLAAGYLLIVVLLAMGPIGLFGFGPLLAIGAVQVYRNRTQRDGSDSGSEGPNYCRHCGEAIDTDAFGGEHEDDQWKVRHCSNCGAPLESATESDREADTADGTAGRPKNCADCGAPNDPDRTTCTHCDAAL
ncbi:zinc ribbon domain-containing protein [Natronorubrum tibetense]|uniref:DZANK-type domain-containing protein n=1 Tax=Natronorubrum tibetense GA33 TaxID=1114856 RepID=L9VU40_9EURY|nr:zinc ribbon domain-containing protein [Natronorubrum tibetense]ELY40482.1 hypothetical protein C496_11553 [Natronorubrum tibetense GA33]